MTFTDKQREIVARKLGYDGPMQGFDEFLNSSPSLGMKYSMLSDKFATRMAKGGMARKKFAAGGVVTDEQVKQYLSERPGLSDADIAAKMSEFKVDAAQMARVTGLDQAAVQSRFDAATKPAAATTPVATTPATTDFKTFLTTTPNLSDKQIAEKMKETDTTVNEVATLTGLSGNEVQNRVNASTGAGGVTTGAATAATAGTAGAPNVPGATTYTAAQTEAPAAVVASTPAAVEEATATTGATPTPVSKPAAITPDKITAASTQADVKATLDKLEAAQGAVTEAAKAVAATQEPTTTAIAGTEAAQGVAGTVEGAPTRTVQEGEMVSGSAVDMARAEQVMSQTQAAQGTVTEDMTVQGQLNKLLTNFDAGNPPPWAAASMRAANAQMAARGLGASSMAGQAIIQATLEAATPIAAADAKVFETMGLQNLSNRQQTAMLVGQQRAAFLGQEFDQAFQTRVLNAARVADIANKNFDAQTQIAIENSRLANSMDIANLSARNAVVLGKMAQMSQLELTNLNNRQQVAVQNAQAFLQMDLKNLDNKQQTAIFKAQEMNDALISDAGFANAVGITNAQNKLEADKVSASLAAAAEQFNAEMKAKVEMANAQAANELAKFNAQQANERERFNTEMKAQVDIANAKILAEVSTANTAATNAANAVNAKNATDLSAAAYAQQSQTYRDLLEMSWKTGESEKDRATNIVAATLSANASTNAATTTANSAALANIAKAGITLLTNYDKVKTAGSTLLSDLGFN